MLPCVYVVGYELAHHVIIFVLMVSPLHVIVQIDRKNRCDAPTELSLPDAIDVVKEAFITAGEVS